LELVNKHSFDEASLEENSRFFIFSSHLDHEAIDIELIAEYNRLFVSHDDWTCRGESNFHNLQMRDMLAQ
jgi:hypothetical protein